MDFYDPSQLGPAASAAYAYLVVPLVFVALALLARRWQHRSHDLACLEQAASAETTGEPAGMRGVIEADGAEPVVRVEIDERGRLDKFFKQMVWRRTAVRVTARAFVLAGDGRRVRVEPERDAVVVVAISAATTESRASRRTRVLEVRPGETVHVAGALTPAAPDAEPYRGEDALPRLVASPGGQLLVVSGERPPRVLRGWAAWWRHAPRALMVALGVMEVVAFGPYHASLAFGRNAVATVERTDRQTSSQVVTRRVPESVAVRPPQARRVWSNGRWEYEHDVIEQEVHCVAELRVDDGATGRLVTVENVSSEVYSRLAEGQRVGVREWRFGSSGVTFGRGATLSVYAVVFALLLALVFVTVPALVMRSELHWVHFARAPWPLRWLSPPRWQDAFPPIPPR